jgi:hypothetical protein
MKPEAQSVGISLDETGQLGAHHKYGWTVVITDMGMCIL